MSGTYGRERGLWAGAMSMRPGLLAFTGRIGDADVHACLQLLIVTGGRVLLGDDSGGRHPVDDMALIPTGVRHRVIASPDAAGLVAYLDASSPAGRAAAARLRTSRADLRLARSWTVRATGAPPPGRDGRRAAHPVLTAAIDQAADCFGGPPDLATLAAQVSMSASRLGHLFAEHLGLSYPVWRRWIRLQRAMAAVEHGASLTVAAHAAGFADSAHLSRTTRAMFGLTAGQASRAAGWRD